MGLGRASLSQNATKTIIIDYFLLWGPQRQKRTYIVLTVAATYSTLFTGVDVDLAAVRNKSAISSNSFMHGKRLAMLQLTVDDRVFLSYTLSN
jgi:hypothetical protein